MYQHSEVTTVVTSIMKNCKTILQRFREGNECIYNSNVDQAHLFSSLKKQMRNPHQSGKCGKE